MYTVVLLSFSLGLNHHGRWHYFVLVLLLLQAYVYVVLCSMLMQVGPEMIAAQFP